MKKQEIYFVTSNQTKFTSLDKILSPLDVNLKRGSYDFNEGRDLNIKAIALRKLKQAKQAFPGKKIIVDDRGLFIPALNGFPGPFVRLALDSFGHQGIIKLMVGETDRRAIFSSVVGYYDGKKDHIFVTDEVGFIATEPKGENLHGWTELLYIYGHKTFPGRTLAELNDEEWEQHLASLEDIDVFVLLQGHLKTKS